MFSLALMCREQQEGRSHISVNDMKWNSLHMNQYLTKDIEPNDPGGSFLL